MDACYKQIKMFNEEIYCLSKTSYSNLHEEIKKLNKFVEIQCTSPDRQSSYPLIINVDRVLVLDDHKNKIMTKNNSWYNVSEDCCEKVMNAILENARLEGEK